MWLQVLQGPGSSPSIRLMPTPTICPKPTPGEYLTQQQTFDSSQSALPSPTCLVSSALIGLTFRPMRAMTSCTTSCWQRLRRLVALRWNETHWGVFELPAVFLFSHLYSSLYCSISCCYLYFCTIFLFVYFWGFFKEESQNKRYEWAEFPFRLTRCSIIWFPVKWGRFWFDI